MAKVVKNVAGLRPRGSSSPARAHGSARADRAGRPAPASAAGGRGDGRRDRRPARALGRPLPLTARAECRRFPSPRSRRAPVRGRGSRGRGTGRRVLRRACRSLCLGRERCAPGGRPAAARASVSPGRTAPARARPGPQAIAYVDAQSAPRPSTNGRRSPSGCAPPSTQQACSSDGREPDRRLRPTAGSASRPARPTSSGTKRWTRRAGGSG